MKQHTIQIATVLALLASSAVNAQQAVQWKVSDGGNGHWYGRVAGDAVIHWQGAKSAAEGRGGYLACIASAAENMWIWSALVQPQSSGWDAWIGLYQSGGAEPAGGWQWISGEPLTFVGWSGNQPDNSNGFEDYAHFMTLHGPGCWNDIREDGCYSGTCYIKDYIIEWDADCNSDGVIDYGQCREGTLPDYNGNNTPDCCEQGTLCVVANYPIQWRSEDGGNGHWYATSDRFGTWDAMRELAVSKGGDLASIQSIEENRAANRARRLADAATGGGPWIGGRKFTGQPWQWSDGSEWRFTNWAQSEPCCGDSGLYVHLYPAGEWNDHNQNEYSCRALIEWCADCNNDGVVDYGQILQGQLADTNTDGVPDVCQCATNPSLSACCPGDLDHDATVGGADIGLLLSNWGPCGSACIYDLNNDSKVNGGDLGLLLAGWGPCPN